MEQRIAYIVQFTYKPEWVKTDSISDTHEGFAIVYASDSREAEKLFCAWFANQPYKLKTCRAFHPVVALTAVERKKSNDE